MNRGLEWHYSHLHRPDFLDVLNVHLRIGEDLLVMHKHTGENSDRAQKLETNHL